MLMRILDWFSNGRSHSPAQPLGERMPEGEAGAGPPTTYKWLPVIDTGYCSGCGACVAVCDHGCLGLVWDFATLLAPEACGSEGQCVDVCPEGIIRMEWSVAGGSQEVGRWSAASVPRTE